MRALSAILPVLALLLFAVCLVPEAAAASVTSGAAVSAGVVGAGALGAGIVLRLSAKKYGDDGGVVSTERFNLDSEADSFAENLEAYGEAKQAEGAAPLRAELAAASTERDDFRSIAVDEILRVEQLNAGEGFDADEERTYLESLPAKKLALHFKKARAKGVSLTPQASGEGPTDVTDEAAFGNVTVS